MIEAHGEHGGNSGNPVHPVRIQAYGGPGVLRIDRSPVPSPGRRGDLSRPGAPTPDRLDLRARCGIPGVGDKDAVGAAADPRCAEMPR
jgi:hypothetical protein